MLVAGGRLVYWLPVIQAGDAHQFDFFYFPIQIPIFDSIPQEFDCSLLSLASRHVEVGHGTWRLAFLRMIPCDPMLMIPCDPMLMIPCDPMPVIPSL
jgi:hypothetical protein